MNRPKIEEIANAVLYEGYLLYPYRGSAIKNRQRWSFGTLYPRMFAEAQVGSDRWYTQTECLVRVLDSHASIQVTARFLHLNERSDGWQEGTERSVPAAAMRVRDLLAGPVTDRGSYPATRATDERYVRTRYSIGFAVETSAGEIGEDLFRIRVTFSNATVLEDTALSREHTLLRSLASAHTILEVKGGEFVSLLDPAEPYRDAAAKCQNLGTYPVLAGEAGDRDTILSSPIILYDYPQIAPESAGALFDGTEIDEILTLRVMTLSDEEKIEMSQMDDHARQILERTESMPPEQLMKMHGALRGLRRVEERELP